MIAQPSREQTPGGFALVTGATGFVGSHLVDAMVEEGWRVRCLARRTSSLRWIPSDRVEIAYGSLSDPGSLRAALSGVTVVFHVAGVTSAASPRDYARVNVDGTRRLLEALRERAPGALVVLCSSLAAAGPSPAGRPLTETDPAQPISPYGASKLAAERLVESSGFDHVIVRPPAVYGPRDRDLLVVFRLAARGVAFRLGPARQRLSLVHARDLALGLMDAAERGAGQGVFYLTDGAEHEWSDVVDTIGSAVGNRPWAIPVPAPAAIVLARASQFLATASGTRPLLTPERVRDLAQSAWLCDDSKARRELGYKASLDLQAGVRDTAEWYRDNGWLWVWGTRPPGAGPAVGPHA